MRVFLVVLMVVAALAAGSPVRPFIDASGAMQVLQRLGLHQVVGAPSVTLAEKLQQGDSPVYYIKLPPIPYYYVNNNLHQHAHSTNTAHAAHAAFTALTSHTTKYPFQKVDVDFTSNGRPTQVYHWTGLTTQPPLWHPTPTTTHRPTTTTTTTTTPRPTTTPKPTKKPWLTFNKYFPYNGRPSGVYVYKPRPSISLNKYKQHYFKHFNY